MAFHYTHSIMRKADRWKYLDVSLMHCANCTTDHSLVRMKLIVVMKRVLKGEAVVMVVV